MFKLTLILSQVIIMSETEDINSCSKPKINSFIRNVQWFQNKLVTARVPPTT